MGNRDISENYRLVNLVIIVVKLRQGIVRDKICLLLERQGMMRDGHHGFVS